MSARSADVAVALSPLEGQDDSPINEKGPFAYDEEITKANALVLETEVKDGSDFDKDDNSERKGHFLRDNVPRGCF